MDSAIHSSQARSDPFVIVEGVAAQNLTQAGIACHCGQPRLDQKGEQHYCPEAPLRGECVLASVHLLEIGGGDGQRDDHTMSAGSHWPKPGHGYINSISFHGPDFDPIAYVS